MVPVYPNIKFAYTAREGGNFANFLIVKIEISRNFCDKIKFLTGIDIFLNFLEFKYHQNKNSYVKNLLIFVRIFGNISEDLDPCQNIMGLER
jgi:hypothetical protein